MKSSKLNPFWLGPALLVAMPVWCQQPAVAPDQTTDLATGETADDDETGDGSSPDPAHGVEAADPEEDFGIGSREKDTVAPPSGRMRSTPIPPVE